MLTHDPSTVKRRRRSMWELLRRLAMATRLGGPRGVAQEVGQRGGRDGDAQRGERTRVAAMGLVPMGGSVPHWRGAGGQAWSLNMVSDGRLRPLPAAAGPPGPDHPWRRRSQRTGRPTGYFHCAVTGSGLMRRRWSASSAVGLSFEDDPSRRHGSRIGSVAWGVGYRIGERSSACPVPRVPHGRYREGIFAAWGNVSGGASCPVAGNHLPSSRPTT